jgi:hypothetical protein
MIGGKLRLLLAIVDVELVTIGAAAGYLHGSAISVVSGALIALSLGVVLETVVRLRYAVRGARTASAGASTQARTVIPRSARPSPTRGSA